MTLFVPLLQKQSGDRAAENISAGAGRPSVDKPGTAGPVHFVYELSAEQRWYFTFLTTTKI